MKIGLIGGTGNMGRGLALRLAFKHEILVGSRSLEKARRIAKELNDLARGFYQSEMEGKITGLVNMEAASESEIVIITLPPDVTAPVLRSLHSSLTVENIVVSTVVPMTRRNRLFYWAPLKETGVSAYDRSSAAELMQEIVKPTRVVSAFQTVPAAYLNNIDAVLNLDVLIAGDDDLAVTKVSKIVWDIPNLRPLRVGPLENSKWIESLTPLLLNAAILNGLHDPSIRVVPWMPSSYET